MLEHILQETIQENTRLRAELAEKDRQIAELNSLLSRGEALRERYLLRWLLTMKTPEDRFDPLAADNPLPVLPINALG